MEDERTIDELIEIAEQIPDRLGLAAGIADVRGRARSEHVAVSVDVQGKLVELEIAEQGIELGPEALAAEIRRLSVEAGNAVLREGLRAVRAGCVPAVADAIEEYLALDEPQPAEAPPTRRPAPSTDEEEFFTLKRA
ncbi:hypothetical protein [Amycolatopsis sp. GM8]|uniref:hypothetical protein n=1 Tax=Amycolatopsis sp. GM8 TaxID=2896530 RepID=UPI001F45AA93|nr:hypothetical protein [Amycolatopsis sp. GM8]